MRDRRIGHQPLDIGLPDRGDAAEEHGQKAQRRDHLLPVAHDAPEGIMHHARHQRHGRDLGRGGKKRRDRRRCALIDIGRPHMERHGRDLERETGQHEHEAQQQPERRLPVGRVDDARKQRGSGIAIGQRRAVKQQPR